MPRPGAGAYHQNSKDEAGFFMSGLVCVIGVRATVFFSLCIKAPATQKDLDAIPNKQRLPFVKLADALQNAGMGFAHQLPNINGTKVIGIDLTKRGVDAKTASLQRRKKLAK